MAAKKKSANKYGSAASKSVEREMKAMEAGTLKSGRGGRKVTNPRQAIAIGLSEARRAGAKVPPAPGSKAAKRSAAKKSATKKTGTKKSAAKQAGEKSTAKKAASKKASARKSSS